MKKKVYIENA